MASRCRPGKWKALSEGKAPVGALELLIVPSPLSCEYSTILRTVALWILLTQASKPSGSQWEPFFLLDPFISAQFPSRTPAHTPPIDLMQCGFLGSLSGPLLGYRA